MGVDLAPYLATPKAVQPQGKLRLNRKHGLAPLNGVFLQETAVGRMRDYVSGFVYSTAGSAITSGIWAQGRYVGFSSTARIEMPIPTAPTFTMVAGLSMSVGANQRICEFYTSSTKATTSGRVYTPANSSIQVQMDAAAVYSWSSPASSIPSGRFTLAVTWDGTTSAGAVAIYINGVAQAITYAAGSGSLVASPAFMIVGNRATGDRSQAGNTEFLWFDNKVRSGAECQSITNAPYQIMERDLPPMIGVTVAGGAPSTAYYRRTLSQFGSRMGSRQSA